VLVVELGPGQDLDELRASLDETANLVPGDPHSLILYLPVERKVIP